MNGQTLICITTCNRLEEVRKYILPYLQFANKNLGFHFLLSLDGTNNDYINFCDENNIPLLYSDEREGVGLSKNRVIKTFPDFDYYFFIEDDIELYESNVFKLHVDLHMETGIQHFAFGARNCDEERESSKGIIQCGWYGGGQFNSFTKQGIAKCGGWDTYFARYRRFGHTEYSYRYFHNGINPKPFCVLKNLNAYLINHDPPHVTNMEIETNEFELIKDEEIIIKEKRTYLPLQTLSNIHFNQKDTSCGAIEEKLLTANRYFFLDAKERRKARARYYFYICLNQTINPILKFWYFCIALLLYPTNPGIKHFVKAKLKLL